MPFLYRHEITLTFQNHLLTVLDVSSQYYELFFCDIIVSWVIFDNEISLSRVEELNIFLIQENYFRYSLYIVECRS